MNELNGFAITKRDRILRAWQESTGLVREYQEYAKEIEHDDIEISQLFATLALNEAEHSAKLLEILRKLDK